MREEPLGDALLEAAHQVLKDELIPALPADRRHAALMVASAMAIAMRQARGGQGRERQELAALASLLAGAPSTVAAASDDVRARLQALNRALGQQIRHAPRARRRWRRACTPTSCTAPGSRCSRAAPST